MLVAPVAAQTADKYPLSAVDTSSRAYIVGDAVSADFPLENAAQTKFGGLLSAFGFLEF